MDNYQSLLNFNRSYRKEINILNYCDNGFGDVLNKVSFLYNASLKYKKTTTVKWHYREVDYNKVLNAELFFKPCEFIKHEKRNEIERPWEHNKYFLFNHEYWPSKILPSKIKTKKIAIDLYTFFSPGRSVINRFKISNEEFKKKLKKQISSHGFEPIDIFHIDNSRGCKFVISDYRDLMNVNMRILSEVDAFIGVEGNISHMCRSMKLPSLLLYNLINSTPPAVDINNNVLKNVVIPYIDSNIQKLVTSEDELIENIPDFINDLT